MSGNKYINPGAEFEGDSYFMSLVPKEAVLVRVVDVPEKVVREQVEEEFKQDVEKMKEEVVSEKLILDQPDQVTNEGKVEHVVSNEPKPLNEEGAQENEVSKEVLLTEDPLDGVKIIMND